MKGERALLTRIKIDKAGQVKLFQVKLPRGTDVRGIETGLRWIIGDLPEAPDQPDWELPFLVRPNLQIGELRMQSCGRANIFFNSEVQLNGTDDFGDFSSRWWKPTAYTHQLNSYETETQVSGEDTMLQGFYRDRFSENNPGEYSYELNVYVWVEPQQLKKDC